MIRNDAVTERTGITWLRLLQKLRYNKIFGSLPTFFASCCNLPEICARINPNTSMNAKHLSKYGSAASHLRPFRFPTAGMRSSRCRVFSTYMSENANMPRISGQDDYRAQLFGKLQRITAPRKLSIMSYHNHYRRLRIKCVQIFDALHFEKENHKKC